MRFAVVVWLSNLSATAPFVAPGPRARGLPPLRSATEATPASTTTTAPEPSSPQKPQTGRPPRGRSSPGPMLILRNPKILVRKEGAPPPPEPQRQVRQPRSQPQPPRQQPGADVTHTIKKKAFRTPQPTAPRKAYERPPGNRPQQPQQFRGARGSLKKKKNRDTLDEAQKEKKPTLPSIIIADGAIGVLDLANKLEKSGTEIVKHMMLKLGVLASVTQSVDAKTARQVVEDFGRTWAASEEPVLLDDEEHDGVFRPTGGFLVGEDVDDRDSEHVRTRAPVVTIMGHVDHGKTSLLDAIRETSVAAQETGGITQGIGAYSVQVRTDEEQRAVTFLDTPGHAAFSEMRERGANCTDVVVLVVAADDGVKAQTIDSIACAKAAGVPVVVAVNKMDAQEADPSRVENELMGYDLVPEEYGGDTMFARVSAKTKDGVDDLLEKLLLQAELLDLKANFDEALRASGVVVEAHVERGLGVVATTLVRRGQLKIGDPFAAGVAFGRVRALFDDEGRNVDVALPSSAVQVVGWQSDTSRIPSAGDAFVVAEDEQTARKVADAREAIATEVKAAKLRDVTFKSFATLRQRNDAGLFKKQGGGIQEKRTFPVLVKADTSGSVEAIESGLAAVNVQDDVSTVSANVVYSGVGDVSKSDVAIAAVSEPGAMIIAFNVAADKGALEDVKSLASSARKVDLKYYGVIYDALDEVEKRMRVVLSPTPDGVLVGSATIKQLFDIGKLGKVAGCAATDGYLRKGARFRVMDGDRIKLADGKLRTLRNVKVDVDRIEAGTDCGLSFQDWDDFAVGDTIECYDSE